MGPPALIRRAVFDINVVVSALLFSRGRLAWLRHVWRQDAVRPLISPATTRELLRVLGYPKFELGQPDIGELLADYLPLAETVAAPTDLSLPRCADPDDQMFLELAAAGHADALITGDADLLKLTQASLPFAILTPAALRRRINQ